MKRIRCLRVSNLYSAKTFLYLIQMVLLIGDDSDLRQAGGRIMFVDIFLDPLSHHVVLICTLLYTKHVILKMETGLPSECTC
jgi:hypothetical protein